MLVDSTIFHPGWAPGIDNFDSLRFARIIEEAVRHVRDRMRCKVRSTAMPVGIPSIRNTAACPVSRGRHRTDLSVSVDQFLPLAAEAAIAQGKRPAAHPVWM